MRFAFYYLLIQISVTSLDLLQIVRCFEKWLCLRTCCVVSQVSHVHGVAGARKGQVIHSWITQSLCFFLATREKISSAACPTPGCKGIGHVKGAKYSTHHSTFGCPYSLQNLNKDSCLVDRLSNNSMTEESDWSYASKQKTTGVKEVKRKTLSKLRTSPVPNSNEFGFAVAWQKNGCGFKRRI